MKCKVCKLNRARIYVSLKKAYNGSNNIEVVCNKCLRIRYNEIKLNSDTQLTFME